MIPEALAHLAHPLPAQDPLPTAARHILARHADAVPDLSGLVVLLPSLAVAAPFARALAQAAGTPALLLPTLTTLPGLVTPAIPAASVLPDSARQSLLYAALRERGWFADADLWALSGEMLRLFDELTLHRGGLAEDLPTFTERIARAYQARLGLSLQFEARLVHELWYVLQQILGGQLDTAAAYALGLARLAASADKPLYAVGLGRLSPTETEFFLRYAQRQPVSWLAPAALDEAASARGRCLAAAWNGGDAGLAARAAALARALPESPLRGRLRLFPAHGLEQEARAAATQVRLWLASGKRAIGVVAQDRLAARRVRALLERAQVLVEDETGWTLSTTAASSAVMRWLDLLADDFFHQDLLDFLKSPLVFADLPEPERREAVYELERMIRSRGIVGKLIHYRSAAHGTACAALVERLFEAQQAWQPRLRARQGQPLAVWLDQLRATLDRLGIRPALEADPAGAQLLATLARLRDELAADTTFFRFGEWRRWLDRQLEAATFRDTGISSPVVFTHLAATRLRPFDAVVLLGCDAARLPARDSDGLFFNQSVRRELGLSTRSDVLAAERDDLANLLAATGEVLVTWQRLVHGEEHLISPWFELLQTVHALAWGDDLTDVLLTSASSVDIAPAEPAPRRATTQPAPVVPAGLIPASISASGYNSLLACPYQYYARHVLRLNELDEVAVEMEKRDFGEVVHRILLEFHRAHPRVAEGDPAQLAEALRGVSAAVFAPMLELNYLSHAWRLRFEALIPAYIEWQRAREQEGWRWRAGELTRTRELPLPQGHTLLLRGTLDRVDVAPAGLAVLDYKTRDPGALRRQLATPGEDVQLPVYVLLASGPDEPRVAQAGYVSLDRGAIRVVDLDGDPDSLAGEVAQRLTDIFAALAAGARLPAQGTDDACQYCEARGLCRRGHWWEAS